MITLDNATLCAKIIIQPKEENMIIIEKAGLPTYEQLVHIKKNWPNSTVFGPKSHIATGLRIMGPLNDSPTYLNYSASFFADPAYRTLIPADHDSVVDLSVAFHLKYNPKSQVVHSCSDKEKHNPPTVDVNGSKCLWLNKNKCEEDYLKGREVAMELLTPIVEKVSPMKTSYHDAIEIRKQCECYYEDIIMKGASDELRGLECWSMKCLMKIDNVETYLSQPMLSATAICASYANGDLDFTTSDLHKALTAHLVHNYYDWSLEDIKNFQVDLAFFAAFLNYKNCNQFSAFEQRLNICMPIKSKNEAYDNAIKQINELTNNLGGDQ